jgi:hypothetical protein
LIQVGPTYYVRDGHHRVSVARMMGQEEIDAEVTVWKIECPESWSRWAGLRSGQQPGRIGLRGSLRV